MCAGPKLADKVKKCRIFKFRNTIFLISLDFTIKLTIVDNHHIDLDCRTLAAHPAERNKERKITVLVKMHAFMLSKQL